MSMDIHIKAGVIGFNSNKTCFISLPSAWLNGFSKPSIQDQPAVYELSDGRSTAYVSWAGDVVNNARDGIELNGLFAAKLGFKHGVEVTIKPVQSVPSATRLFVEPVSPDDWEILELHAGFIENNLLNQVRLVWEKQVLPVWVTKSICIFVTIVKLEPTCKCAILQLLTEVIVSPKSRRKEVGSDIITPSVAPVTHSSQYRNQSKNTDFGSPMDELNRNTKSPGLNGDGLRQNQDQRQGQESKRSSGDSKPDEKKRICSQSQFSVLWDVLSYLKTLVFEPKEDSESGLNQIDDDREVWKSDINVKLRVQSLKPCDVKQIGNVIRKLPSLECLQKSVFHENENINLTDQPMTVYMHSETLLNPSFNNTSISTKDIPTTFIAKLIKLHSPVELEEKTEKSKKLEIAKDKDAKTSTKQNDGKKNSDFVEESSCVVRVVVLGLLQSVGGKVPLEINPLNGCVLMPEALRRQVGFELSSYIQLRNVEHGATVPTEIHLTALADLPPKFLPEMVLVAFESWVTHVSSSTLPLICCQGTLLKLMLLPDVEGEFLMTFSDKSHQKGSVEVNPSSYYAVHPDVLKHVKLKYNGRLTSKNKPALVKSLPYWSINELDSPFTLTKLESLGGITELSKKAISHLTSVLAVMPLASDMFVGSPGMGSGGLLISGSRGSGKSCLSRAICNELTKYPHHVCLRIIDCKPLRAKRVESIKAMWLKVFNEAAWRQPSVILLDDLDQVAPSPSGPEQEMSGEAVYYARVAKALMDILNSEIIQQSRVVVMATSSSRASLHHSLVSSRGTHYFQEFVEIKPPDLAQRKSILDAIMVSKQNISLDSLTTVDVQHWASKTQGCMARDLVKLVDRAAHAHMMTHAVQKSGETCLDDASFEHAMQGFQATSLQNVSLHKAGNLGWKDVGNLTEVKSTLMETLQWPSKYPELFANCPLRLRSGILLYGAPGTGKTLLAGVVAKECGLNFISIKGPELLSKYIGASEQAVRETFYRAQSAKPCILFFDEFDAIAPRRGHDSTGVTDRVVNQLLTQLDGVEGLDGVYVLGATSRPDLIDPALLRPGRLDKSICCPLPDEGGRHEILEALTRNIHLNDDVDLTTIASMCEHFTGADFKALLYNAQLEAIHQCTNYRYSSAYQSSDGNTMDDVDKTVFMFDKKEPSDDSPSILYMPTLEEGVVEMTPEFKEKLLTELSPWSKKKTETSPDTKSSTAVTPAISQDHLVKAATHMRPSVSETERRKYQAIYENFVSSRGGNFASADTSHGKRMTLA